MEGMSTTDHSFTEAAILSGIVNAGQETIGPEAARSLLAFSFSAAQEARMRDLIEKNAAGSISDQERAELESYARVGSFLSLLHSKARLALNRSTT